MTVTCVAAPPRVISRGTRRELSERRGGRARPGVARARCERGRAVAAPARTGRGVRRTVVLNTSMVALRGDGHHQWISNSPHGFPDCLHYCLPGPADLLYNRLLYHFLAHQK